MGPQLRGCVVISLDSRLTADVRGIRNDPCFLEEVA